MQHIVPARRRRASSPRRSTERDAALVWRSPERHLWVATDDGEFAGMAVQDRRGYVATGPTATPVGRFPSLAAAQAALEPRARPVRFTAP